MSLIGPRPERPAFCAEFEKRIRGWHYRTYVRPGLSGLAQVTGGYDLLPKEKILLDLWNVGGTGSATNAEASANEDTVDLLRQDLVLDFSNCFGLSVREGNVLRSFLKGKTLGQSQRAIAYPLAP